MLVSVVLIFSYFFIFFIVAQVIKNNSIVDIGWGLGFVIVVWFAFFISNDLSLSKIILNLMISIWGLRLFFYILKRNVFQEEDFRYQNFRKAWGKYVVIRAFFQVFMLQGLFMLLISFNSLYFNINSYDFNIYSLIGAIIFIIGILFEAVGDSQLKKHLSKNKTLMTTGLWKYTRHPNYFGESLLWFGIFIYTLINGAPFYLIFSPLTIFILVRYVSGVPMLEKKMVKYDGYREYMRKTNIFFPWSSRR
ncbi:hypothetical protein CI105_03790 [Candidatus Izimaplasma bacterium ZiA1]|uniref:DUF1295 domain-containing protein n=1 Tax=Candidatus Izimoplasma sp. ZiA1 TaxID=2024899 RepID=UPI000BAA4645|nr:hypothetical protein CI105_03790 [Candidatus Izimaplasma bacterium ZiA1]